MYFISASLNENFCGVQHCYECLHLLKVKGRELGANALQNRGLNFSIGIIKKKT